MDFENLLRVVLLCTLFPKSFSANCSKERKCKTARIHGLKTTDCYRMDWKEFPKCLPSDVEVLELSYNRIRKVSKTDLQRYPYITHLYLTDNLLVNLDDDLFKDLTRLETLDLSLNAIAKVPPAVFQHPRLKTLYLSHNWNINVAESIEEARPISRSSLTKLDMSHITDEGESAEFPDFADFPYLAFLNISGDQFSYLSTKHFAGLCNLQILANENITAEFENDCDCWKINRWLKERNVQFTTLLCPINEKECFDQEIDQEDLDVYETCRQKFAEYERYILLGKIGIGVGVVVGAILLVVAVYFYRRWKKRRQEKEMRKRNNSRQPDNLQLLNKPAKV